ncbi:hemophore-related protein [Nocardia jiangxiensis]|uniref:Hemophore-related protein n=1 Tax=Nocardia jiangxiensis TaxID=282685 RepID=A0ABW6RWD7_9NOCA|nr:hemophore-related protein [Nocardia jiangxiensis]
MRMLNARCAIVAIAVGGFAAGAGLLGSTTASADMIDDFGPLLTSTCSFDQIDAAMHQVAPAAAARLDASPVQRNILQFAFSQPAEKRAAALGQLAAQWKKMAGVSVPELSIDQAAGPMMQRVADSCHQY